MNHHISTSPNDPCTTTKLLRGSARHPVDRGGFPVILTILLILLLAAPSRNTLAQSGGISATEFRSRLQFLISDSMFARASIGIDIIRVEDGSSIASIDAGKLFHPASNMKLLTSATALAILPADYAFDTRLYTDARIRDSVLEGNLYVRGGGDPLLDSLDIDSLATLVGQAGIRRIDGDLVGDVTLFDTLHWGKGWMWDDEPSPDEAFLSVLSFNRNSVTIEVGPGRQAGLPLAVLIDPVAGYFTIENLSSTYSGRREDTVTVRRPAGTNRIVVEGRLSDSSPPQTFKLSVFNPAKYFLKALQDRLASKSIVVKGKMREGVTTGPVFIGGISTPLGDVLRDVNKISSNLSAENLLKAVGLETAGPPGAARTGLMGVANYLRSVGTDPGSMILADGSGVSWYNAVTPGDLVAVLTDQYHRQSTFREFFESLPVSGVDGTLKNRSGGRDMAGRIAAKTGTITGVSTLSGYAVTLSHELIAFSIMINHYPGKIDALRVLQDRILTDLVRLSPIP